MSVHSVRACVRASIYTEGVVVCNMGHTFSHVTHGKAAASPRDSKGGWQQRRTARMDRFYLRNTSADEDMEMCVNLLNLHSISFE